MAWGKAVPELVSAGLALALWISPASFSSEWFRAGVFVMLLEFFVVHASGFLMVAVNASDVSKQKRTLWILGLSAFYFLFLGLFVFLLKAWWMLIAFAWLIFGKLQAVWAKGEPTDADRGVAAASWALSVAVYLFSVAGTAVPEGIPALGVTTDIRDAAGMDPQSGVWEAEPHRALAGAVIYFTIMGLSRPLMERWRARMNKSENLGPR